ncbi:MAG: hydrogenobyrinic acid a,c-diamide synthase (glutamine-hydrolyzing) [Thiohalocapsa sp.]|uniref:cobyrinate a,c-diamide synthase n=1 Tax=Thiohalocapsa sp. TaxID=2497641 RepID=UPI0025CE76EC|nr:cobyrinate a,c-diamide synthase [Thiohalocapsa sp.]MCG6941759.1 hydrogenobyrinic acid a,c-diamide synthase (glutamine-hydrolyzing) [Thiohalocapsa sp.]
MPHIYLSAARKSSGKTTLSIGLTRALRRRGHRVQPFKKGPDYIDPLWLTQAAGRACLNLDYHTTPAGEIQADFARALRDADLGFIEGNVGLFDSVDVLGAQSNAEMAKLLGAPVVLVVDTQGMTRGIAPLLLGYLAFDPALHIAGVILNKVGGERHATNLRRVVEHYTDLPVLGCVPRLAGFGIEERHLGLMPSNEADGAEATVERITNLVAAHVDLEAVERIAATAPSPSIQPSLRAFHPDGGGAPVRIGIARDDAFGFYYPDDLAALARGGAELIPFSPVADTDLPDVDALFIGGGFPEMRMRELEANTGMRAAVADFIRAGGPVYAECGGLMYLAERLHWHGHASHMCGVLHAEVAMHDRPQGRGYVRLAETEAFPWPRRGDQAAGQEIRAHEFHHSAVVKPDPDWVYAYEVLRGQGIDGRHDGIVQHNLLANYAHLRDVGGVAWTERFLAHVRALA